MAYAAGSGAASDPAKSARWPRGNVAAVRQSPRGRGSMFDGKGCAPQGDCGAGRRQRGRCPSSSAPRNRHQRGLPGHIGTSIPPPALRAHGGVSPRFPPRRLRPARRGATGAGQRRLDSWPERSRCLASTVSSCSEDGVDRRDRCSPTAGTSRVPSTLRDRPIWRQGCTARTASIGRRGDRAAVPRRRTGSPEGVVPGALLVDSFPSAASATPARSLLESWWEQRTTRPFGSIRALDSSKQSGSSSIREPNRSFSEQTSRSMPSVGTTVAVGAAAWPFRLLRHR